MAMSEDFKALKVMLAGFDDPGGEERNRFDTFIAEREAFQARVKAGLSEWHPIDELHGVMPWCPNCMIEIDKKGNEIRGPRFPLVILGQGIQQGYFRFRACPECGITVHEVYNRR